MSRRYILSPTWVVGGKPLGSLLLRPATGQAFQFAKPAIARRLVRGGTKRELRQDLESLGAANPDRLIATTGLLIEGDDDRTRSVAPAAAKRSNMARAVAEMAEMFPEVPPVRCFEGDLSERPKRLHNGLVLLGAGRDLMLIKENKSGPCRRCMLLRALAVVAEGGTRQHRTLERCRPTLPRRFMTSAVAELFLEFSARPLESGEAVWTCEEEGVRRGEVLTHPDCCEPQARSWKQAALGARDALKRRSPIAPPSDRMRALSESPFAPIEIDERVGKKGTYPLDIPFVWGSVALSRSRRRETYCVSTYGGLYGSGSDRRTSRLIALSEGVERLGTRAASGVVLATAERRDTVAPSKFFGWATEEDDSKEREYCAAWELTHNRPRLIPLETVAVALPKKLYPEACHREPFYSGAASHVTFAQAVLNGTLEVLHRDAFFVSWYRRRRLSRVTWPTRLSVTHRKLRDYLLAHGFELTLHRLTLDMPLPMLLLKITATKTIGNWPKGGTMVFPGAGFVPEESLGHCLRLASAQMVSVMVESAPFKDPLDPVKVRQLSKHAAFWPLMARYLDPGQAPAFRFLDGTDLVGWDALKRHKATTTHARLGLLRRWFVDRDMLWFATRLTDSTARRAGFEVAKVVVPGLVAMAKSRRSANLNQPRVRADYPDATVRLNPDPHPLM